MAVFTNVVDIGSYFNKPLFTALETLLVKKLKVIHGETSNFSLSSIRKSRGNDNIDFIIYVSSSMDNESQYPDENDSKLNTDNDSFWSLYVKHLKSIETGKLAVTLQRPIIFQNAVSNVIQEAASYGSVAQTSDIARVVMLNYGSFPQPMRSCGADVAESLSISDLRLLLIGQHLRSVLLACRIAAYFVPCITASRINPGESDLLARLGVSLAELESTNHSQAESPECLGSREEYGRLVEQLKLENLYITRFESNDTIMNEAVNLNLELNLKKFLIDHSLHEKKGFYHGNLNLVRVSFESPISQQLLVLERQRNILQASHQWDANAVQWYCCHIAEADKAFRQQQIDVAWRIVMNTTACVEQIHILSGPVVVNNNAKSISAKEFFWFRHEQITKAYRSKYGAKVKESLWGKDINDLTKAVVRFELLSSVSHHQLKLDVSCDGKSHAESKGGIFVMYNCARLATLFRHFDDSVKKGLYPPLPKPEDIDWSKLQDEGEWELLFNFVLPFPRIVTDCIKGLYEDQGTICMHKICQFLMNFASRLSVYYSRIHILCEPRPHLIAIIHARLYLMKAVQQVMHNALALLGIEPFNRL